MTRRPLKLFLGVSLVAQLGFPLGALGSTSTIEVDMVAGKETPTDPSVNVWGNHTVILRVVKFPEGLKRADLGFRLDIPGVTNENALSESILLAGSEVTLRLLPCRDWALNSAEREGLERVAKKSPGGGRSDTCGVALQTQENGAWIFSRDRSLPISVVRMKGEYPPEVLRTFSLQLVNNPWFLDWSAGFNFLRTADHSYRLDPTADNGMSSIRQLETQDWKYEFASFVHYLPYQWSGAYGFSVGISTKLPADSLNIAVGADIRLRTFGTSKNAAYLTFGFAFAKRDRLHPDFEGKDSAPATLSKDQLIQGRYGLVPFVAITFGFLGGEKEFTGVYSGK